MLFSLRKEKKYREVSMKKNEKVGLENSGKCRSDPKLDDFLPRRDSNPYRDVKL